MSTAEDTPTTPKERMARLRAVSEADAEQANAREQFPSPSAPLPVARKLLAERTDDDGNVLVRHWQEDWWTYAGPHWVQMDPNAVRKWVYERLENVIYASIDRNGEPCAKDWNPDRAKVGNVMDAMARPILVDRDTAPPIWLSTGETATGYVPCLNGLVDIATQQLRPATPDYFGTVAIPINYDPAAPSPTEWLAFLYKLWPPIQVDPATCPGHGGEPCKGLHEAEEITTLQQWFGYVLSGRLDLQKILLMVGPPRCGKGTIARVLTALVGKANTSAPTLAGIATNFGLESSIGKALTVIADARMMAQGQEIVMERLLNISGQDPIDLDRKNRTAWHGTMTNRIMILSNDLPKFLDASGAIASRFVILRFSESFLGREDITLGDRINAELPGILNWALAGVVRLGKGRLHEGDSHREAMGDLYDLVSPVTAFIKDVCELDRDAQTPFRDVYEEYRTWCEENTRGIKSVPAFSADLRSCQPLLKTDYRPRDLQNRKLPRHVKGLRISAEWSGRVRTTHTSSSWRGSGGVFGG